MDKNKLPRNICPVCKLEMLISHQDKLVTLYKCKKCGDMVMVQEFIRNEVRPNGKPK